MNLLYSFKVWRVREIWHIIILYRVDVMVIGLQDLVLLTSPFLYSIIVLQDLRMDGKLPVDNITFRVVLTMRVETSLPNFQMELQIPSQPTAERLDLLLIASLMDLSDMRSSVKYELSSSERI